MNKLSDMVGQINNLSRIIELSDEHITEKLDSTRRSERFFAEMIDEKINKYMEEYLAIMKIPKEDQTEAQRSSIGLLRGKVDRLEEIKKNRIKENSVQVVERIDGCLRQTIHSIQKETNTDLFSEIKRIDIGEVIIPSRFSLVYKLGFCNSVKAGDDQIAFRFGLDDVKENILLKTTKWQQKQLYEWFEYIALQLAVSDSRKRVIVIDNEELGTNYPLLDSAVALTNLHVLRDEGEIQTAMMGLVEDIEWLVQSGTPVKPTIIMVNGMVENFVHANVETLLSILKYGWKCGVYLVLSFTDDQCVNTIWNGVLEAINTHFTMTIHDVDQDIYTGKSRVRLSVDRKRMQRLLLDQKIFGGIRLQADDEAKVFHQTNEGICIPIGRKKDTNEDCSLQLSDFFGNVLVAGEAGTGKTTFAKRIGVEAIRKYAATELQLVYIGEIEKDFPECFVFDIADAADTQKAEMVLSHLVFQEIPERIREFDHIKGGLPVKAYADYRLWCKTEKLKNYFPRLLVIIDDYDGIISRNEKTRILLSDLVKKGCCLGIHTVLLTEDPGGILLSKEFEREFYTKIAFRLPENVAKLLFSKKCLDTLREHSSIPGIPALLTGEALINDNNGDSERFTDEIIWPYIDKKSESIQCRAAEADFLGDVLLSGIEEKGVKVVNRQKFKAAAIHIIGKRKLRTKESVESLAIQMVELADYSKLPPIITYDHLLFFSNRSGIQNEESDKVQ